MIAGALEIQMSAGIARLVSDMQKAKSTVTRAVADIEKILGVIGVGFSAHVLLEKIKSVVEGMDRLQNASEKTGASVENLSKLQFFAGVAGSNIDGVTTALVKLSKGMAAAGNEGAPTAQALKFLGLSAKDAAGNLKDPSALLSEISKKLIGYKDGAGKAAIAQALFGKAGAEMLPMLKKMAELGDIEASVTGKQAKAAEEYQIAVARLNRQSEILWTNMVSSLVPLLTGVTTKFNESGKAAGSFRTEILGVVNTQGKVEGWVETAVTVFAHLADGIRDAYRIIAIATETTALIVVRVAAGIAEMAKFTPMGALANKLTGNLDAIIDFEKEFTRTVENSMMKRVAVMGEEERLADKNEKFWAARRARLEKEAIFGAPGGTGEGGAPLNFALGDEKKIAAELKLYEGALQSLEQQLGKLNDQTQYEITLYQLLSGSLQKVSEPHGRHLLQVAREIDLKRQAEAATKSYMAAVEALKVSQEQRGDQLREFNTSTKTALQQIKDETALIGMTDQQREETIALRELDNKYKTASIGLNEQETETLRKLYEVQKNELPGALAARRAAEEGKRQQVGMWQSIESAGHQAFLSIFDTSKSVLERIRDMLKTHLLDILYQITVRKWIINLATSVSGASVAQSAFGAAGTIGSAGGIMDSFGLVRGLSTIFSGSTAMDASTAALSTLGTEGIATYAAMEAAGATAATFASTALSALPYIGVAVAAASLLGLFDSNDEPPPGYRRANTLQLVGGPGNWGLSGSEIPEGGAAGELNYGPLRALLNDPSKFDPATLARLSGTQVSVEAGKGSAELVAALTQALQPAAQAAAAATAAIEAHTAKINEWKLAMKVAADPLLYWTSEVTRLDKALKTSADSTDEWQVAFTAALKKPMDETNLARWEKLGIAIAERVKIDEAAAQRALQLSQTKVQMEVQLLEAQGKSVEALAVRRRLELAALDATLRPLQEQINAAEELAAMRAQEAAAAQTAAALAAERRGLELRLLDAQGNAAAALAARRADELAATNDLNRELLRQIYAAEDLATSTAAAAQAQKDAALVQRQLEQERASAVTSAAGVLRQAYQREAADLQQMADKWKGAAASLRAYGETLVGIGSGGMSYAAAARQFAATAASARLGDLGAIGNLQSASEQFRTASLSGSGSALAYARDVARIQAAVADTVALADRQESVALRQLDRLSAQVSALVDINDSVISVQAAITALNAAVAQLNAVSVDAARDARTTRETVQAVANGQLSFSTVAA